MRRKLLAVAAFLSLASAAGCSWMGGSGGPVTPERRASLVERVARDPEVPQALFSADTPLSFVLEADFSLLEEDRALESEERPGRVILRGAEGQPVEVPVEVRTRGRFRLRPSTCVMPPLRLDFPASQPFGTLFDGQDKLKLVTHCRDRKDFEQNVLEEYLAYRIYNFLTDWSFRVQLAEITYLDTSGESGPVTRRGFLIEDDDALAARMGGEVLDIPGLEADMLEPRELGLMYVFQYMIGNTDWSTDSGHNMKFVRTPEAIVAVPYDFDFSGLVDAPYAGPAPSVADYIHTVRERFYLGYCQEGIDYQQVISRFQEARSEILSFLEAQPDLSYSNRVAAQRYLQDFFEDLGNPNRVELNIVQGCRR